MNEFEPVLLTQLDNNFLIGVTYHPENAIDTFSRDTRCKRFEDFHNDLLCICCHRKGRPSIARRTKCGTDLSVFPPIDGESVTVPANCCIVPRCYGVSPYMAFSRPCA
jgi:hypothetical protein